MQSGTLRLRRHKAELNGDAIGIGKRESHLFGICEPLSKDSSFTERGERSYSERPWVDFPGVFDFVCLANEQVDAFSAGNRRIGELEVCGLTSAEFQRKEVPNGNQIAMIGKDLGGDGMLEYLIPCQCFACLRLMLQLCLQETKDLRSIRRISMKSFAQAAEVK